MKADGFHILKTTFAKSDNVMVVSETQLKQIQKMLVDVLKDFMSVAQKYHLSYTLSGGSVLGAIRHQGFIPWDDDIDINMPRRDFEKFSQVFEKELGQRYKLCAPGILKNHGMSGVSIRRKGTLYRSFNEITKPKDECGLGLDIFVVENTYDKPLFRKMHGVICLAMGYLLTCRKNAEDYEWFKPFIKNNAELKRYVLKKVRIGKIFRFLPLDYVTKLTINWYKHCTDDNSKYVTIPSGRNHFFGEMAEREGFLNSIPAQFEKLIVPIPRDYDLYMQRLYGSSYMTIPPENEREVHTVVEFDMGENVN